MNRAVFALSVLLVAAGPVAAAELTLTFGNGGLVTVDAKDVTVRQILTEWARVGQTRIVNMERVASPPVTIKIDKVPEKQALEIILRAVPGYMAARRPAPLQGASDYDRILIIASTSVAPPPPRAPTTTSVQGTMPPSPLRGGGAGGALLNPGALPEPFDDDDSDDDEAAVRAAAAAGLLAVPGAPPNMMPPGVNLVPGVGALRPPVQNPPPAPTTPTPTPANPWNAPVGTAMPGPPTPQPQPAQPGSGRPLVPPRPPEPDR